MESTSLRVDFLLPSVCRKQRGVTGQDDVTRGRLGLYPLRLVLFMKPMFGSGTQEGLTPTAAPRSGWGPCFTWTSHSDTASDHGLLYIHSALLPPGVPAGRRSAPRAGVFSAKAALPQSLHNSESARGSSAARTPRAAGVGGVRARRAIRGPRGRWAPLPPRTCKAQRGRPAPAVSRAPAAGPTVAQAHGGAA